MERPPDLIISGRSVTFPGNCSRLQLEAMSRANSIKRHQVAFLLLLVFAGCGKAAVGILVFFGRYLNTAAAVALLVLVSSFAASRVIRRNRSDSELQRIADFLSNFSAAVFGTLLLVLVLNDWRGAATFTVLLVLSSSRLLALLPPRGPQTNKGAERS